MRPHFLAVAFVASGTVLLSGGAAFAASGYGPTAPTGPANAPGGFTTVAATQTVSPSGGTVIATVAGATVAVVVPAGAFAKPVQVELTVPDLASVNSALPAFGFSGYNTVAGLGVKVLNQDGSAYSGNFLKPVSVNLTGSSLGVSGEQVLMVNGPSSATKVGFTPAGSGRITVSLNADPDLAVINPTAAQTGAGAGTGAIPGATNVHTGIPFTGETDGALALIAAGAVAAAYGTRRTVLARR